jgi:hypothetical protein
MAPCGCTRRRPAFTAPGQMMTQHAGHKFQTPSPRHQVVTRELDIRRVVLEFLLGQLQHGHSWPDAAAAAAAAGA